MMTNIARACLVMAPIAILSSCLWIRDAAAELGPRPPEPDRFWIVLLAQSPIRSGANYEHMLRFQIPDPLKFKRADPRGLTVEFRDRENLELQQAYPFAPNGFRSTARNTVSSHGTQLKKEELRELAELPAGNYTVAIVQGDERISNPAEFLIDPAFELDRAPVISIVGIEPPPYREMPIIGVRVSGSTAVTSELTLSQVSFATVVVNGIARRNAVMAYAGSNPRLKLGDRWLRTRDFGYLTPVIEAGLSHEVHIEAEGYTSNTIVASPERNLGAAWDAAMTRKPSRL